MSTNTLNTSAVLTIATAYAADNGDTDTLLHAAAVTIRDAIGAGHSLRGIATAALGDARRFEWVRRQAILAGFGVPVADGYTDCRETVYALLKAKVKGDAISAVRDNGTHWTTYGQVRDALATLLPVVAEPIADDTVSHGETDDTDGAAVPAERTVRTLEDVILDSANTIVARVLRESRDATPEAQRAAVAAAVATFAVFALDSFGGSDVSADARNDVHLEVAGWMAHGIASVPVATVAAAA